MNNSSTSDNRDDNNTNIQIYAQQAVAKKIWKELLDAQDNNNNNNNTDGYSTVRFGYALPLEMTIHVGSDNGKLRPKLK